MTESMIQTDLPSLRHAIQQHYFADERTVLTGLIDQWGPDEETRRRIVENAADLVTRVRSDSKPTLMEKFLSQYGLSTEEGLALMSLAEAMLRIPDAYTAEMFIADKVGAGHWDDHKGDSEYLLINQATWSLFLTDKVINPIKQKNLASQLKQLLKKVGEPIVRQAVGLIMKELGRQFVLGRNIKEAIKNAKRYEKQGYLYSYDMLGEAAQTQQDADRFFASYQWAIQNLADKCLHKDTRKNPGISIKLSALHPRYEQLQKDRVMAELAPRVLELAKQAKDANMGFNIDAEEADRLDLSLHVIESVLSNNDLADWDGFGVVVQAFSQRASYVVDWLYGLATSLDRKIMVRLVKGAYWDSEIKHAQTFGVEGFSVYTQKHHTDISYIACAKKLLSLTDRIYPQFATHNAHSVASILAFSSDKESYEFQRLHGMGEALHDQIVKQGLARCRIYAPCGEYKELLAYLVRRLLENGANSSFVNQIVDKSIPALDVVKDPMSQIDLDQTNWKNINIASSKDLFNSHRSNSVGWEINDSNEMKKLLTKRDAFHNTHWQGESLVASTQIAAPIKQNDKQQITNPANSSDLVGDVQFVSDNDVDKIITSANLAKSKWSEVTAQERHAKLIHFANLLEQDTPQLFALLTREAGKTLPDAMAELREAVDFVYFYAEQSLTLSPNSDPLGTTVCISPWNFPLAIFLGQILASLAAGNVVIAKPAEATNLIAVRAIDLLHQAGIDKDVVQLVLGEGSVIGQQLTSDSRVDGICFTGSTATAQRINQNMANHLSPTAPLIAETGGLNAMIVDGTALPEQVVRDVITSAFQSAGQRCSALRILYVQDEIADSVLEMLYGAMDELVVGDPWLLNTDVGPVIDNKAKTEISNYIESFKQEGKLLKTIAVPKQGNFVAPSVVEVNSINDLSHEVFGPVLHVARYKNTEVDQVVDDINNKGFGLTFAIHSRIQSRINKIKHDIKVGNVYVNRNQIGAVVASQPFGGEGLSGTGPKAGGPLYVNRFRQHKTEAGKNQPDSRTKKSVLSAFTLQTAIEHLNKKDVLPLADRVSKLDLNKDELTSSLVNTFMNLPGPTGEDNILRFVPRGVIICLGPDADSLLTQVKTALSQGNSVLAIASDAENILMKMSSSGQPIVTFNASLDANVFESITGFDAIASNEAPGQLSLYRHALAKREGAILPLITETDLPERYIKERHVCEDTTASGGNASLLASS